MFILCPSKENIVMYSTYESAETMRITVSYFTTTVHSREGVIRGVGVWSFP